MCGCASVPSPCLQVCVVPKIRHLDPSSKFLASKTFAFLKNWTELEIRNSSNFGFFWKFRFFIGGRAYQRFHEWIQFWAIFWRSWICIASKIWPQSIFQRTVCLYNGIDFLWINGYIWKKPNLGGWISSNLFKFSHLFRVLFLRFVSFAKFTERHFLKAQTSTLEFSEYLKLN